MSVIASWARRHWPELAWALFAALNFGVLVSLGTYETVPFHLVWVSLTVLYGYRVWGLRATFLILAAVCVLSTITLGYVVRDGPQGIDELTEVPLMSALFLAMVWHARRRQAALERLSRAAEREREFVSDASHHIKTPLAIARGLTELIAQARAGDSRASDFACLLDELDRLDHLTEDLLVLAAAEQSFEGLDGAVDVEDLVVAAAQRWSRAADRAWRIDVRVDGVVPGDRHRLDVALDAAIENAVFATHAGEQVELSAAELSRGVVIEVRDAGVGIAPDLLPRVFDRFVTVGGEADGARRTGLGLAIVKAHVEAHGGEVTLASTLGRGTTLAIWLPGLTVPERLAPAPLRSAPANGHF
jgi:two-component system OmpR family sensor kinase